MDHTTSGKCFRRLLVAGLWIVALDFATLPGASAGDFDLSIEQLTSGEKHHVGVQRLVMPTIYLAEMLFSENVIVTNASTRVSCSVASRFPKDRFVASLLFS
jgi:hypothetical protein